MMMENCVKALYFCECCNLARLALFSGDGESDRKNIEPYNFRELFRLIQEIEQRPLRPYSSYKAIADEIQKHVQFKEFTERVKLEEDYLKNVCYLENFKRQLELDCDSTSAAIRIMTDNLIQVSPKRVNFSWGYIASAIRMREVPLDDFLVTDDPSVLEDLLFANAKKRYMDDDPNIPTEPFLCRVEGHVDLLLERMEDDLNCFDMYPKLSAVLLVLRSSQSNPNDKLYIRYMYLTSIRDQFLRLYYVNDFAEESGEAFLQRQLARQQE
jgi:hypothetical protein